MNENQRVARSTFKIVEPHPVHIEEATDGRVLSFGLPSPENVVDCSCSKRGGTAHQCSVQPASRLPSIVQPSAPVQRIGGVELPPRARSTRTFRRSKRW